MTGQKQRKKKFYPVILGRNHPYFQQYSELVQSLTCKRCR